MCAQASRDLGILPSAKILAPPSGVTWCFAHGGCGVGAGVSGFPRMLGSLEQEVILSVDHGNDPWLDPSPRSCSVDWEPVDLSWWWHLPLCTFRRSGLAVSILFHVVWARKGPTASRTVHHGAQGVPKRCFTNHSGSGVSRAVLDPPPSLSTPLILHLPTNSSTLCPRYFFSFTDFV